MPPPSLVLASSSQSRAAVLKGAGIAFVQHSPNVDEDAVKTAMRAASADVAQCAERLAEMKALDVSAHYPDAYVMGCDQMLECSGQWFDKPKDMAGARAQLQTLRGRHHRLFNGMAIAHNKSVIWRHSDRAELEMRAFSDAFLDQYLATVGERVLFSVGSYQLEGPGAQLFCSIHGDFFSILGLPLLPLLAVLREHSLIQS
jgi:septum formation protein